MGLTYTFNGRYGGPSQIVGFTGTADGDDVLVATFPSETSAGGSPLVTDFTANADGTFTATYRTQQKDAVDSVTISGIENVNINVTNTYIWEGQTYRTSTPDRVRTGNGNDTIATAYGDDLIDAGLGIDRVDGGEGNDGLTKDFGVDSAAVRLNMKGNTYAGPGSYANIEYLTDLKTGNAADVVDTTAVTSAGSIGDDRIDTRGGNDLVVVRNGQDTVIMGAGNDRLVVDWREASFTNNTTMTLAPGESGNSGTFAGRHANAPSVTFSGVEHFTIHTMVAGGNGSNLVDTIKTGTGDDIVFTYASNDVIDVGTGIDQVDGGVGHDGLAKEFGVNGPAVRFNLAANTFSGPGSYRNLEYFTNLKTGNAADFIDTTAVTSAGSIGDDRIETRGGNDTVVVRNGQDTVVMGDGNDQLVIDWRNASFTNNTTMTLTEGRGGASGTLSGRQANAPSVTFSGVESFVIHTMVSGGNGSNLADTIRTGSGNDKIFTYASADKIYAGAGNDTVDAGVGNDLLDGGAGADQLVGGTGNDTYAVDHAGDRVIERLNGGNDVVISATSYTLAGGQEIETLQFAKSVGLKAVNLTGNEFGNTLRGSDGVNTLKGGLGADVLSGGLGSDILDPGSDRDRDTISYASASESSGLTRDVVLSMDLNGEDRFSFPVKVREVATASAPLSKASFDRDIAAAVDPLFTPGGNVQAALLDPSAGNLDKTGHLFLVVDANNDGAYTKNADYVIELVSPTGTLDVSDFI